MARKFTDFERHILSQPVPSLDLAALPDDADDIAFAERAAMWHLEEGWDDVLALSKVLGVVPASEAEIRALIH